jgi:hypothetical protein
MRARLVTVVCQPPAALCTLGILLSAAVSAAPVPADARASLYYPTAVGAKLVYAFGDGTECETVVVTDVKVEGDAKVVTEVSQMADRKVTAKSVVSEKGLFESEMGMLKEDPPLCLLKLPHKSGQTWELVSRNRGVLKRVRTAYGPESVKVPAGAFDAIRVVEEYPESPGKKVTYWYAAGVGVVKVENGSRTVVLKSFSSGSK